MTTPQQDKVLAEAFAAIQQEYEYETLGADPTSKVNVKTAWSFLTGIVAYVFASASILMVGFLAQLTGKSEVIASENIWLLNTGIVLMLVSVFFTVFSIILARKGLKEVYQQRQRGRMFGWLGQIVSWALVGMIIVPVGAMYIILLVKYVNGN